eukprot:CAMPEP_0181220512 /NCGR_PEP_ID=MMETSP1096-20121128/28879_1 /TAXON_ID=156174 ORGANISM="Chrysochromulina ericina, Strain CCMP281" /NCGR_SAMPLE_ID=MMETSP1096 /ASSEMBLY_ACC=CAM_ASM_000453 /LENGTH=105 /DNA_ID=CAMNT_0023313025 /DNA_START=409 /DNA_END=726 /DNA_ORIENTATION=-
MLQQRRRVSGRQRRLDLMCRDRRAASMLESHVQPLSTHARQFEVFSPVDVSTIIPGQMCDQLGRRAFAAMRMWTPAEDTRSRPSHTVGGAHCIRTYGMGLDGYRN